MHTCNAAKFNDNIQYATNRLRILLYKDIEYLYTPRDDLHVPIKSMRYLNTSLLHVYC